MSLSLDINAALDAAAPLTRIKSCKVVHRLNAIPAGANGRDRIVAVTEDPTFPAEHLSLAFNQLGLPVSPSAIRGHRRHTCPCYR